MNFFLNRRYNYCIIWISFLVALILQIIPWPNNLYIFQPSWVLLMLICLILLLPNQIGIGTGFLLGTTMDLISGSILGIRALAFSIITYLVVIKSKIFYHFAFFQQFCVILSISLLMKIIVLLVEFLVTSISFHPKVFYGSIIDGILYPWLFWLMKRIFY